jgi:hypothetical protein
VKELAAIALLATVTLPSPARAGDKADEAREKDECASAAERAQADREVHHLRAARQELLRCARATCPPAVRVDCATWLDQVSAALPTVALHARNDRGEDLVDVTVDVDGERVATKLDGAAIPVDPGEHVVHFAAAGLLPADVRVVVAEGDKARAVVALLASPAAVPPPPTPGSPPTARRVLPWVGLGLGVAALGAFAGLEVAGHAELSSLESGCGVSHSCRDADVSPVRTKFQLAGVALGVGLAGVAAGTVGLVLQRRGQAQTRAWVRVGPVAGGGMIGTGRAF